MENNSSSLRNREDIQEKRQKKYNYIELALYLIIH